MSIDPTDEESIRSSLYRNRIPVRMHGPVVRYLKHKIKPGSFLTAVLSNKLVDAYSYADDDNRQYIENWALWLYNDVPGDSWGSEAVVVRWLAKRGEENAESV